MDQVQIHGGGSADGDDEAGQVAKSADTSAADSLLDEIDGLLEQNAEEFVRNYVQKGGQ